MDRMVREGECNRGEWNIIFKVRHRALLWLLPLRSRCSSWRTTSAKLLLSTLTSGSAATLATAQHLHNAVHANHNFR